MKVSRLPAALAYKLIRRGCSPADLATLAMLWPRGGHVPQQTRAGRVVILSAFFGSSRLFSLLVYTTHKSVYGSGVAPQVLARTWAIPVCRWPSLLLLAATRALYQAHHR